MPSSGKRKGDRAELEVQALLRDHLGVNARRALGAGRKDDMGDIDGVPYTVIQVVNWRDVAAAVRSKPLEAEEQRLKRWYSTNINYKESGQDPPPTFAATFVRLRGGDYRVVQTPEQWFAMYREAL